MKLEELRKLSVEELNGKIKESKEELFNLRFQQATGNLEKPARLRELRKQVAKINYYFCSGFRWKTAFYCHGVDWI